MALWAAAVATTALNGVVTMMAPENAESDRGVHHNS